MKRLACLVLFTLVAAAEPEIDTTTGLRIDAGWEQVRIHCGGCHSHALITQQRADRDTWQSMIRWMQSSQNLWQFAPEVETEILDYLSTNYPPRESLRRAPLPVSLRPPQEPHELSTEENR
jgi:hypothetical protein